MKISKDTIKYRKKERKIEKEREREKGRQLIRIKKM